MQIEKITDQVRSKDGFYSVTDIIRVCGEYKSRGELKAWKRISEEHKDMMAICHHIEIRDKLGRKGKKVPCMNIPQSCYDTAKEVRALVNK